MIEIDEALARYARELQPLPVEAIGIGAALHRVLAEDIVATTDLPRFDQSAMDGYALAADAVSGAGTGQACRLPIAQRIAAGDAPGQVSLPAGQCARILTGAPLPAGADTVIPQELADRDGDHLVFTAAWPRGRNIRRRGEELCSGTKVADAGVRVTPGLLAAAINAGTGTVQVYRRPRLRILVSGDEVRPLGSVFEQGQIPDSNGPLLQAILARWGYPAAAIDHVGDRLEAVQSALSRAFAEADLVISTGGASVGDRDFLPAAAEALGVRRVLWKVAQKPGKPLYFGVRDQGGHRQLLLALPGNPGAVLIGALLHLRRILELLEGVAEPLPVWQSGRLAAAVERDSRRTRLVRMRLEIAEATVLLHPLPHQDSHMLSNLSTADVLVRIEAGTEAVAAGSLLPWLPLP